MTPTIYLLLSITVFFFITTCAYAIYCNQRKAKLAYHPDFSDDQSIDSSHSIEDEREFIDSSLEELSIDFENDIDFHLELKKCNQRLNRNLKTLSYISFMKANNSLDGTRLNDLDNLKQSVQYEVVRITQQINFYKSQINSQVAA